MSDELGRARGAAAALEGDLAGALALQQQEAQSIARERDAALARAAAAEKHAADLEQANDKLFQQQQVVTFFSCTRYTAAYTAASKWISSEPI